MSNWYEGLYKRSLTERQRLAQQHLNLDDQQATLMGHHSNSQNNEVIENYLMDYALPEGLLVDLVVNDHQYTIPMVTEEPSVVAAACNGAKRVAKSGGFHAETQQRLVTGQVVLTDIADLQKFKDWVTDHQTTILDIANDSHPSMKRRGAGAKQLRVRHAGNFVSLDVLVDVDQAMGANTVNTMAEAVGHYCTEQGYRVLAAILSNYATDAVQTVTCHVAFDKLTTQQMSGRKVAKRISELSDLAQVDPARAVTHNKGIMNGIDAAVIASGNDWRSVEAGAHAYAARDGQYRGLSQWRVTDDGLKGIISLPLTLGVVGGSIKLTTQSKLNYQMSQIKTAQELSAVVASIGLAQNLAALRALATKGIQAGHMKLQYRSLAMSVGATAEELPQLVKLLTQSQTVDATVATRLLEQIRKEANHA